jgi:hypothetical protein
MRERCGATVVAAAACLLGSGCHGLGRPARPPDPFVARASVERPRGTPQSPRCFTIALTAFIPDSFVLGPSLHPQSYRGLFPPTRLVFAGDGRGFDLDSEAFRARQVVTIVPDAAEDADGFVEGSAQNLGGVSRSFEAPREGAIRGGLQETSPVDTEGMVIEAPVRLGPHAVRVRLRTAPLRGPRNGLIAGSPSIDWDFTVTVDVSGPEPVYEVTGRWDGYPAMELAINHDRVLAYMPGSGTAELLKLLPGYGDVHFNRRVSLAGP